MNNLNTNAEQTPMNGKSLSFHVGATELYVVFSPTPLLHFSNKFKRFNTGPRCDVQGLYLMGKDLSTADSESKISKLPSIPRHHVSIICEQHLRHYCPARHVMRGKG